jgi:phosphatidylglycerol:prolipoprotein diacylglycerol transferase
MLKFIAIEFPNINPVIISFGTPYLALRWYSLAYILGFVVGGYLLIKTAKYYPNHQLSKSKIIDLIFYIAVGVIIGGRLGNVILYNMPYYLKHPLEIFAVWKGGMAFHGGLIGVIIAIYLFAKKNKMSLFQITDMAAPLAPLALFFGRIANFINQELYGKPTQSSIGVIFPKAEKINGINLPRHPTQLYEAFGEGLLLLIIMHIFFRISKFRCREKLLSGVFLTGYGFIRFIIEPFKEVYQGYEYFNFLTVNLTRAQLYSAVMIIAGIYLILKSRNFKKKILYFTSTKLNEHTEITNKFYTKTGGASSEEFNSFNLKYETKDTTKNIEKNYNILSETLNVEKENIIILNQQHTNKVIKIFNETELKTAKKYPIADASITNYPDIALGILTADCIPILLYDPINKILANIHASSIGIKKGVIVTTIKQMRAINTNPKNLIAALGPAIHQKSYEVQKDFLTKITANLSDKELKQTHKLFKSKPNSNSYYFNLIDYAKKNLKNTGVLNKNIEIMPFDTYKEKDLFFSCRRASHTQNNYSSESFGRTMSIIMKNKNY